MAIMIPAECDVTRRPMSEQIVFSAIKQNLSDAWTVFHSFDYVTRDLNKKRWDGEIDFLLYHPDMGLLVLEVKGGMISYKDGQWYQNAHKMDPVEQAKRNKYAVMRLLQKETGHPVALKFAHTVCFPSCSAQQVWPVEAHGIVLTGDGLPYIESFAEEVLRTAQLPPDISEEVSSDEIMRILSPFFEYGTHLCERIGIEEQQFFRFTEQQCAILDALENFPKLQIQGCAGSGKTVMAIKKAQRLAEKHQRVLLLCYNQMLATHLKRQTQNCPGIKAAPFFEYCINLLKIPEDQLAQYRNNPKLYQDALPKLLKQYIMRHCLYYDAVIVDEGQDFTKEAWEAISMLVPEDGFFYIFFDGDQNIFNAELNLPDFGIPVVKLTKNCRNTKKIFEALAPYRTEESGIMESSPEGAEVQTLTGNCRINLESELKRLVREEGVPRHDIVILGAHTLDHTSIGDYPELGGFKIVPHTSTPGSKEVSYFTYMKFKGCEKKVVILLDVDENDPRWDKRGLYTAMSRAIHQLIILHV